MAGVVAAMAGGATTTPRLRAAPRHVATSLEATSARGPARLLLLSCTASPSTDSSAVTPEESRTGPGHGHERVSTDGRLLCGKHDPMCLELCLSGDRNLFLATSSSFSSKAGLVAHEAVLSNSRFCYTCVHGSGTFFSLQMRISGFSRFVVNVIF